jgi:protein-tyrosine-phosphatase
VNKQRFKLLFLCTSNSARSIIAEYLVKRFAGDKFDAVSAGASPKPHPNTLALKVLSSHSNIDVSDARSKSWDEFSDVKFDFVITLCDIAPARSGQGSRSSLIGKRQPLPMSRAPKSKKKMLFGR